MNGTSQRCDPREQPSHRTVTPAGASQMPATWSRLSPTGGHGLKENTVQGRLDTREYGTREAGHEGIRYKVG